MAVEREKKKPGVMLYFDILPALEMMSSQERGDFFLYILNYAQNHTETELKSEISKGVWAMMKGRIDYDDARYKEICRKRSYAAYVKKLKDKGHDPLDFEDWLEHME